MTGFVVTILTVSLAAVLTVAGFAKFVDHNGSRDAARGFGIRDPFVGVVALGVPLVELGIAMLLLPSTTRWWAAVSAIVLLLAFSAAIGRAIARGEAPDCHCFGQLHSAPVGWRTLARNGALVVLGLAVVLAGRDDAGPGVLARTSRLEPTEWFAAALGVVLVVVVAVGGYVVVHVLRSYGRVLVRIDGLEARLRDAGFDLDEEGPDLGLAQGTAAPEFWLPTIDGARASLGDLLHPARPLLLVFTSPTCEPCAMLMPEVARWQRDHDTELTVAVLSDGEEAAVRAKMTTLDPANVLLDESLSAYGAYGANGTPSAVLVSPDGLIASPVASGGDWIASLVEEVLEGHGHISGLPIGADAPAIAVDRLDDSTTRISALVDGPTVVLFWNPGCGYCRSIHGDVRAWEDDRPGGAPALVVVSAGNADEVREEGFAATVLLDGGWELAEAFGADGTPMAVLLDGSGRIASSLVTGGDAVLGLLAGQREERGRERIPERVNDKETTR